MFTRLQDSRSCNILRNRDTATRCSAVNMEASVGHELTPDEKNQCAEYVREAEQAEHPGATISVLVGDEIGDDGKVQVRVVRTTFSDL